MVSTSVILAWAVLATALLASLMVCGLAFLWQYRRTLVEAVYSLLFISVLFAVIAGFEFLAQPLGALFGISVVTVTFFALRIHIGRLPEQFLRHNTFSTALAYAGFCVFAWLVIGFAAMLPFYTIGTVLMSMALAGVIGLSVQAIWALAHYIYDVKALPAARHKLPTVTVAIPARNETMALTACLEAALQSDYQKLEVLVLDDCSYDNTSALIRSYAHLGVRFVKGEAPSVGWLGKSNAYSQLAKEASGDVILFMGVDSLLAPDSISRLVTYMEAHKLDMVSVLPKLDAGLGAASLLQDLRYVWQIILPLQRHRVPVSSEAWAIRRHELQALGGFAGVKHKIIPEGSFARRLMLTNRYHFVIANHILPMDYVKSWRSQQATAVRLLYPTLKRRPLVVMATVIALAIFGIGPFIVLCARPLSILWWVALLTATLSLLLYAGVLWRIQSRWWWLSMWLLPLVLVQQIILLLVSMARYEFSTVDWKGRNVCYPVLLHKRR